VLRYTLHIFITVITASFHVLTSPHSLSLSHTLTHTRTHTHTQHTLSLSLAQVPIEVVRSSLLGGLEDRLRGRVDVLLFNPPYVPTPDEEVRGCGIEAAWAGGEDGRRVIDVFLPKIHVR
jgi:methylase of polypeptide subunit release factors